ncbi:DUF1080 domain-containing protein [Croceitalea marina]|uniref:DUF1080 domain-containing protein n=1 Tax=Croceitalea marina TaxID=1775166 RepID=A0ABW5MX61_9FLAO
MNILKSLGFESLIFFLIVFNVHGQDDTWKNLLDEDLSQWDRFMGVPHYSIEGLKDIPKGNGMEGTPLGLNNDPLNVFSVKRIDGELVLYISGQIYGGLTSKERYGNYHLKMDFKWGVKKWEPRLNDKRDNGILYHCNGPHGAFWNVWMKSQEFQVQEGDMGDYFGLAGAVNRTKAVRDEDGFYAYNPDGEAVVLGTVMEGDKMYRCVRTQNHEKPNGEWNSLELICFNGKSWHIVNGQVVMVLEKALEKTEEGFQPVVSGKLQIQSEAAEAFYRNIKIKTLDNLPDFLK